jgi:hypothetical protein
MPFTTAPNLQNPDEFYATLIAAHDGLSPADSEAFNARLILLLANQIGDREILAEAIRKAGEGLPRSAPPVSGS